MFDVYEYLNELDYDVSFIDLSNRNLTHIPDLTRFVLLHKFWCNNNRLTQLPALPLSLRILRCNNNLLQCLPDVLPINLQILSCINNCLTSLPKKLPPNIMCIFCGNNLITKLPQLPSSLYIFTLFGNPVEELIGAYITPNELDISNINRISSIIERFTRNFYREIIRKTIWVKYLEPKIRKKYSPENLLRQMTEAGVNMDENIDIYTDCDTVAAFFPQK